MSLVRDNENKNYSVIPNRTPTSILVEQKLIGLQAATKKDFRDRFSKSPLKLVGFHNYENDLEIKNKNELANLNDSDLWFLFANRAYMYSPAETACDVAKNTNDSELLEYIVINAKRILGTEKLWLLNSVLNERDDVDLLITCAQNYQTSGILPAFLNPVITRRIQEGNKDALRIWINQYEKLGLNSIFLERILVTAAKKYEDLFELCKESEDEELTRYCMMNGKLLGLGSEQILDLLNLQDIDDRQEFIRCLEESENKSGLESSDIVTIITDIYKISHEDEDEKVMQQKLEDEKFLEECVFQKKKLGLENKDLLKLIKLRNDKSFTKICLEHIEQLDLDTDKTDLQPHSISGTRTQTIVEMLELLDVSDIIDDWILDKENGEFLGPNVICDLIFDINHKIYKNSNGELKFRNMNLQYKPEHRVFDVNDQMVDLLELVASRMDETCLKGYYAFEIMRCAGVDEQDLVQISSSEDIHENKLQLLDYLCEKEEQKLTQTYSPLSWEEKTALLASLFKKHVSILGLDDDFIDVLYDQIRVSRTQNNLIEMLPKDMSVNMHFGCKGDYPNFYPNINKILGHFFPELIYFTDDSFKIGCTTLGNMSCADFGKQMVKFHNTFSRLNYHQLDTTSTINFSAECLNDIYSLKTFLELYSSIESLLYLTTNEKGNLPYLPYKIEYDTLVSKKIQELLSSDLFTYTTTPNGIVGNTPSDEVKSKILDTLCGINSSLLCGGTNNHVIFNTSTMDAFNAEEIMKTILLLSGLIKSASKLSKINNKEPNEKTPEETKYLELFETIKNSTDNEEKLKCMLELAIPDSIVNEVEHSEVDQQFIKDIRKDFLKRYYINREVLTNSPEGLSSLHELGIEPIHLGISNRKISLDGIEKISLEQSGEDIVKVGEIMERLISSNERNMSAYGE